MYERAIDFYGDEFLDERLFVNFAKFEERQREYERARVIYKYALGGDFDYNFKNDRISQAGW